jgi:hypothetical protein
LQIESCPSQAQENQRPLSDFLNAQGSTTCFTPPAPAQLGFGTGVFADGTVKMRGNSGSTTAFRLALIDYAGKEANSLLSTHGINLGQQSIKQIGPLE